MRPESLLNYSNNQCHLWGFQKHAINYEDDLDDAVRNYCKILRKMSKDNGEPLMTMGKPRIKR